MIAQEDRFVGKISEEERQCLEKIFEWELFQDGDPPHSSFDPAMISFLFSKNLLVRSKDLSTEVLNSFGFNEIPPYLVTDEAIFFITE